MRDVDALMMGVGSKPGATSRARQVGLVISCAPHGCKGNILNKSPELEIFDKFFWRFFGLSTILKITDYLVQLLLRDL